MGTKIKVIIADDHQIVRDGLRSLVEKEADMEVIATLEDGRTTVKMVEELKPDVVIMDVSMPGLTALRPRARSPTIFPTSRLLPFPCTMTGAL